jgi:ribosomal protein S18 acetylase RimI-like enzyme
MIEIRKATLNDAETIATYLLLAMQDIVYKFIREEDPLQAKAFMLHFVKKEYNQYSYQNCWVAENGKEVLAAVNIYDGADLIELRKPVIQHIQSRFNVDFQPDDETQAGEYYIDSLGVHPSHQGKGIGTTLLAFLIEEYTRKNGQTLGLLVDKDNPSARRLYLNLGFKIAGEKVLFGKYMEHLQMATGIAEDVKREK